MIRRAPARLLGVLVALVLAAPAHAADHLQLGISVGDPASPHALDHVVRITGVRPPLVMWYQSWSEPLFYDNQMQAVERVGATPIVTWDPRTSAGPISLSDVANGSHDEYLREAAQTAKGYGRPLYVRFAHEMNLLTTIYGSSHRSDTPASFVAAWRHVVSVFREAGATNVRWIWSPNVDCGGRCPFTAFYPGDAWVDWVALDGYNVGTAASWSQWTPLGSLFGHSYDTLAHLTDKPMMIGETASTDAGGSKPDWILDGLLHDVPDRLPRVRSVIWFDRDKEHRWQIDSSPDSLTAFRAVARSPLYVGHSPAIARRLERAARHRTAHTDHVDRLFWGIAIVLGAGALILMLIVLIGGRREPLPRRRSAPDAGDVPTEPPKARARVTVP